MAVQELGKPRLRGGAWWLSSGVVLGIVSVMGVVGCGAPVAVVPAVPESVPLAAVSAGPKGLGDGQAGEFVSARFGLKLALPDGKSWRIDDHGGNWLIATHAGAASELVVRTWREEAVMNRGRCEERARLWRKIPERESADIVEKRSVNVPPDFDTVVEVGVIATTLQGKKARAGRTCEGLLWPSAGREAVLRVDLHHQRWRAGGRGCPWQAAGDDGASLAGGDDGGERAGAADRSRSHAVTQGSVSASGGAARSPRSRRWAPLSRRGTIADRWPRGPACERRAVD